MLTTQSSDNAEPITPRVTMLVGGLLQFSQFLLTCIYTEDKAIHVLELFINKLELFK